MLGRRTRLLFFEKTGLELVECTVSISPSLGNNSQSTVKDANLWKILYMTIAVAAMDCRNLKTGSCSMAYTPLSRSRFFTLFLPVPSSRLYVSAFPHDNRQPLNPFVQGIAQSNPPYLSRSAG